MAILQKKAYGDFKRKIAHSRGRKLRSSPDKCPKKGLLVLTPIFSLCVSICVIIFVASKVKFGTLSPKKIDYVFVRETWPHMSACSGFDRLFSEIQSARHETTYNVFVTPEDRSDKLLSRVAARLGLKRFKTLSSRGEPSYVSSKHLVAACAALECLEKHNSAICILSSAENQFNRILQGQPNRILNRIIVCFHQPPSWLRLNWRGLDVLRNVKGIVCLCKEQNAFFRSIAQVPVLSITHGVSHDYFTTPTPDRENCCRLLFVGQWLRDFETLGKAMQRIWSVMPTVELDCVVPWAARDNPHLLRLARNGNVRWHADLRPDLLLKLYHEAEVLLLPLLDATANNSLLEGMATGLPIVSTDVGGTRDYVPIGGGILCPIGDGEAHADAVLTYLRDKNMRRLAHETNSSHVRRNLDWAGAGHSLIRWIEDLAVPGEYSRISR